MTGVIVKLVVTKFCNFISVHVSQWAWTTTIWRCLWGNCNGTILAGELHAGFCGGIWQSINRVIVVTT